MPKAFPKEAKVAPQRDLGPLLIPASRNVCPNRIKNEPYPAIHFGRPSHCIRFAYPAPAAASSALGSGASHHTSEPRHSGVAGTGLSAVRATSAPSRSPPDRVSHTAAMETRKAWRMKRCSRLRVYSDCLSPCCQGRCGTPVWWRHPSATSGRRAAGTPCHSDTDAARERSDAGLTRPSSPRNHSSASRIRLGSPKVNPS